MYKSIPLERGHDSIPVILQDMNGKVISFDKEYGSKDLYGQQIDGDGLGVYHRLHRQLANKSHEVCDHQPFKMGKKIYKGIRRSVIDLDPEQIYAASRIQDKEPLLVTSPAFVEGKTLDHYGSFTEYDGWIGMSFSVNDRIESVLRGSINAELKKICENHGLTSAFYIERIQENNIKVLSDDGDYLDLLVTDIGNQIFSDIFWRHEDLKEEVKKILRM